MATCVLPAGRQFEFGCDLFPASSQGCSTSGSFACGQSIWTPMQGWEAPLQAVNRLAQNRTPKSFCEINKGIQASTTAEDILYIFQHRRSHEVDYINVTAAFNKLSKVRRNLSDQERNQLLQLLTGLAIEKIGQYDPRGLASNLRAFAALAYFPGRDVLDRFAAEAVGQLRSFSPQDIAHTLWAFAKLRYNPGPCLMGGLAAEAANKVRRFNAHDIAHVLWSYASLAAYPGEVLLSALALEAAVKVRSFNPQDIANALWAFAKLAYEPGMALRTAIGAQVLACLRELEPQAIANVLWAYAKLGMSPGDGLLQACALRALQVLPGFTPQHLANTLWAFATLGHHPGCDMLATFAADAARKLPGFSTQHLANTLWAFARLRFSPGDALLAVFARAAIGRLTESEHAQFAPHGGDAGRHQAPASLQATINQLLYAFDILNFAPEPAVLHMLHCRAAARAADGDTLRRYSGGPLPGPRLQRWGSSASDHGRGPAQSASLDQLVAGMQGMQLSAAAAPFVSAVGPAPMGQRNTNLMRMRSY